MDHSLVRDATTALRAGDLATAQRLYETALAERPADFTALHYLGVTHCRLGDPARGRELILRALALRPGDPAALLNLGHACLALDLVDDALPALEQAVAGRPDLPGAARTLEAVRAELQQKAAAIGAHQRGDFAQARALYEQLLARRPGHPEVLNNAGVLLYQLGDPQAALARIRLAIQRKPALADAHANLGAVLKNLGQVGDAITSYRKALELNPGLVDAHYNLGHALVAQQRLEDAVEAYSRALALAPGHAGARVGIAHQRRHLCDWRAIDAERADLLALVQAGAREVVPFDTLVATDDPFVQALAARRMSQRLSEGITPLPPRPLQRRDRIRLGFLSSDFRRHPVAWLVSDLVERLDRGRFEVLAYSHGQDDGSEERARLQRGVDRFTDIRALSADQAAERIRADAVDILVDLNGHTLGARMPLLARRAAPLQVAWLGYPGAVCAPFVDYVLADAFVAPEADQPFFDERIARLPDCFQPCAPVDGDPPEPAARADCGLPETGFVFCAFNNPYKITPDFFGCWMRLLQAVPGSVLWLVENLPAVSSNLRREAAARGVDPARLVFAPRAPLPAYFARLAAADLFLDTLPYNAGTTANDALRAGLPLLSCAGQCFAGRMAGSLLRAAGLPDLVTTSLPEYESLALALARDPARLAAIRARVHEARRASALFDAPRFARHAGRAFEQMWERALAGLGPASFDVAPGAR